MGEDGRRAAAPRDPGTMSLAVPAIVSTPGGWPIWPVRMVVPHDAGSPADHVARVLAGSLPPRWGQRVVADNQLGAGPVNHPVNQLRDPCILEDGGRILLFLAMRGEAGIAMAELTEA